MKISRILVSFVFLCLAVFALPSQTVYVNFAEALQKSIYFYDAEKCGFRGINRLEWRGPCHLEDEKIALKPETTNLSAAFIAANKSILDPDGDGFMELSGGFHDAGDHVQFGLPQGYTASTLGWGLYEFKQSFIDTGTYDHMLEILKYFTDFFLKCAFKDASGNIVAYCFQTGDGSIDHAYWGPPELQDPVGLTTIGQSGISYPRPAWFAYPEKPASDQCANAAASLTVMYLIYKDIDATYAYNCLETAKALYRFAVANRGLGDSGGYYGSAYDYDELSWAAVWLYEATGTMSYIDDIMKKDAAGNYTGYMKRLIGTPGDTWVNIWVHCWDVVWGGMFVKLATLFPSNTAYDFWARWNIEFWSGGQVPHRSEDTGNGTYMQYTPGGYGMINTWGSARYNTAAQLCGLIYAKHKNRPDMATWAKGQMTYIMGDNPMRRSYIVGYGAEYAMHPHHRAAHGSFTNSMDDPPNHRHILWGALAGGPDGNDVHVDSTKDYVYNEVACDYNAGFVGALAGLYDFFGRAAGHKPLADFPPPEPDDGEPFLIEAKFEQENKERTQVTVKLHGYPRHQPKPITGLTCRYFFNISELINNNQTISEVFMEIYYDEQASRYGGSVTGRGPFVWNAAENIYYYEFAWDNGGIIGTRELQFGIIVKQAADYSSYWDPTNDYSRQNITTEYARTDYIPVYRDGTLVYGQPPGGVITPTPTPGPTPTPTTASPGDVNSDKVINIADALLIAQYSAGLNPANFNAAVADVNYDGKISILDALKIAQYSAGLIPTL
jgi:hypothetical protein